jgi:hypothetical protein
VVDEVHAAGGRIAPQLTHVGQKRSTTAPDWTPPALYESPSGLSMTGERVGQPMSEADIADTIGASRAQRPMPSGSGSTAARSSASSASRSDLATTVGPIARACGANVPAGRRLATVTSMFLRAKAWARA